MTPGREANEWVAIRLSEPRRKHCLPGGFERVMILRYSPRRGSREERD
jgi:hypothetical protein